MVEVLRQAPGIDVNRKDESGSTALMWAVRKGQYAAAVELSKSSNIDLDAADKSGDTALVMAAKGRRLDCLALLLHKGAVVGDKELEAATIGDRMMG